MAHIAAIARDLGKDEDVAIYEKYHDKVCLACHALRHTKEFPLDTDRQAMLVRPLILYVLSVFDPESEYILPENEEMPSWLFGPRA